MSFYNKGVRTVLATLAGVLTRYWGTASSSLDTLVLVVRWVSSSPPQPSHTHSSRLLRSLGTK